MLISPEFNRLYHSCFLGDIYKQMVSMKRIIIDFGEFKEALKYANKDYPRYTGTDELVSTIDINNVDLVRHIEWIVKWAGEYGICPLIIEQDWERLMQLAHEN